MPVLAMTREMGSLGSVIAQEVARHLGYRFLRNDLLRDAAREYRVRESRLVGVMEAAPGPGRAAAPAAFPVPAYLEAAVLEAALEERTCSWAAGPRSSSAAFPCGARSCLRAARRSGSAA